MKKSKFDKAKLILTWLLRQFERSKLRALSPEQDLAELLAGMLDNVILLVAWTTLFGIGLASLRAINIGWQPFMWLHLFMLAGIWSLVFLRHRIAYRIRCLLLLALIFIAGIAGYAALGPAADAKVAFVFVAFLTGLFLPLRWMLAIWSLQGIGLILLAAAWVSGSLNFQLDFPTYAADPLVWATGIWTILVYSSVVAYVAFAIIVLLHRKTIQLEKQAEHTQTILDGLHDGVITIDAAGIIRYCNPAALRCFSYSPEQLIGQNVSMLMPSPHRDAHDSYLRNYQTTGKAQIIGVGRELEGMRADGSLFPMELAVTDITRGGRIEYLGIVRDISERKRIENMKSQFVSTVSHELRTPLTAISGALGLLNSGSLGVFSDKAAEMVDIATKNSKQLIFLINDLLDFEKIASGHMRYQLKKQPLLLLLEQTISAHGTYSQKKNIQLRLLPPSQLVQVHVDEQRLIQVLSNLLSNAIKFSPPDGIVTLSAEVTNNAVRVSVVDQGPGVPSEFKQRLFDRFAQADASDTRKKGGTGLGLAISRELITAMGGNIGYQDSPEQGACFWFELPLAE